MGQRLHAGIPLAGDQLAERGTLESRDVCRNREPHRAIGEPVQCGGVLADVLSRDLAHQLEGGIGGHPSILGRVRGASVDSGLGAANDYRGCRDGDPDPPDLPFPVGRVPGSKPAHVPHPGRLAPQSPWTDRGVASYLYGGRGLAEPVGQARRRLGSRDTHARLGLLDCFVAPGSGTANRGASTDRLSPVEGEEP